MNRYLAGALLASALTMPACAQDAGQPAPHAKARSVTAPGNPILAEGEYYSTDPAPFVADDKLWILAGRDMAPRDVNDFIMPEWQLLETGDPASGKWTHYPEVARPHDVFAWAEEGRAYAGQIVQGPDKRFYFYAPVIEKDSDAPDRFAIGVAVADSPTGPWRDAHPQGPIVSQRVPVANNIQNIDPTVLIDEDGRVYLYWGTFGQARSVELERDMVTVKGREHTVEGLEGFFEAPWVFRREGTYYMLYAANKAGPGSECTPAVYHACIAYATATKPFGDWTYRGVVLDPVSSTTSHPGAVAFKGQWYLAYHTADAKEGGHFRRSVALDKMEWDDSVTPARIRKVVTTRRPGPAPQPTRNLAASAWATASNSPVPVQYWIAALNDGVTKASPLPPDMWGSWMPENPESQWIEYRWDKPVTLSGSRIWFWNDQPAGSSIGVAPPASWQIEYWDKARRAWRAVSATTPYGTEPGKFQTVAFAPVTTRCLRAVMQASGKGDEHAGMAVQEWEALGDEERLPTPRSAAVPAPEACD
ncbi:family 43 glycosylhydrolase [Novosphingobium aureum]|nr:family 43 glycosylhydrolase [Novosphingobium aureum]